MNDEAFDKWLQQSPEDLNLWISEGLELGLKTLGMENAIVSEVNNREYLIKQAVSKIGNTFSPGDNFELNNTYCEAVVRQHKTIHFINAGNIPEMRLHPVYQSMHMEAYIGTPVINKEERILGTLNFSARDIRKTEFTAEEVNFVEKMAARLAQEIGQ